MDIFIQILNAIQIIFLVYLGFASVYIFLYSFVGLFPYKKRKKKDNKQRKFVVMIPGYKEDQVIFHVAEDALQQDYPSELYDVVVVADSFRDDTLENLKKLPIKVIEVSFDVSTKAKALNKAMSILPDKYDAAIILDADNLMETDFITRINEAFSRGFIAVQGHRVAKNTNTSFAILDAISEEINNHIFRKGHRVIGLSAPLIGSGMAFEYKFFKNLMLEIKAVGGFDKDLELRMTKNGIKIDYEKDAYVYDEKVQSSKVFSTQRRRWLSAQLIYFSRSFGSSVSGLFLKGNIDFFDQSIQYILPPRVLLLGLLTIIFIISLFVNSLVFLILWGISLLLCILAMAMAMPLKFYNIKTLYAVFSLPLGFFLMFLSLLRIKGANKKFIHTEHTAGTVEKKTKSGK